MNKDVRTELAEENNTTQTRCMPSPTRRFATTKSTLNVNWLQIPITRITEKRCLQFSNYIVPNKEIMVDTRRSVDVTLEVAH